MPSSPKNDGGAAFPVPEQRTPEGVASFEGGYVVKELKNASRAYLALDAENAKLRALLERAEICIEPKCMGGTKECDAVLDEIRAALENKHAQ
jgi:hypothetical protein